MPLTRDEILKALSSVIDTATGESIQSSGMVRALQVNGGNVRLVLEIDPGRVTEMEALAVEAEARVKALDGCNGVQVVLTSHSDSLSGGGDASTPQTAPPAAQPTAVHEDAEDAGGDHAHAGHSHTGHSHAPDAPGAPKPIRPAPEPLANGPQKVPGIDRVLAVASGKGGVGKSTVAANLACALAAAGRRVGLLDADVYGPSQPKMLGVSGRPTSPDGRMILPLRNHGVTLISIGLMTSGDEAVVWRGPMLMGALQQMMSQVQWGALDVLIVDLPPGTGDVQMTLCQKFVVDGAIIVSTPQDVALIDARKGISMFREMKVPIHGMIENMSTHICSNCGHEEHVFGHGGVATEADKIGVPLLAEVPLHLNIRIAADSGTPIAVGTPDAPEASVFGALARRLIEEGKA